MRFFTKNPEPTSEIPDHAPSEFPKSSAPTGDIFQELIGSEIVEEQKPAEKKKTNPLLTASKFVDVIMKFTVVATIVFSIDMGIRALEEPGFLENFPMCDYFSYGIDNYLNDECKTVKQIALLKSKEREEVYSTIINNLLVLVPKRLEANDALSSPEVQFIKERTGDSRIQFVKVLGEFQDIVNDSAFKGEDIECSKIAFTEKGMLDVSCEFYGAPIDSPSKESKTSRMTAFAFLEKLENSNFRVTNPPKTIGIQKYSTAEVGIRSTFSTVSKLELSLRYVPSVNGNRP